MSILKGAVLSVIFLSSTDMVFCYYSIAQGDIMVPRSWKEFKDSGMLWWINGLLHVFGWAIMYRYNNADDKELGEPMFVYPVKVGFRGFDERVNEEGYKKITRYMAKEAEKLLHDVEDK